ncbi:MAG: class I SAM-dependent methyltransferase [Planctomycetota bacterium]
MPAASRQKSKKNKAKNKKGPKKPVKTLTAETADKHRLYQAAVQNVESEIDFVDETFEKLRGRKAQKLREDFCGTGCTSCEWVKRREDNTAAGLDIDGPTLAWGRAHNVGELSEQQRPRVQLIDRDVREPGDAVGMDCILAMNFSYWLFQKRSEMIAYFKTVRESLADDGVFFLDFYGGTEAGVEYDYNASERRECELEGEGPAKSREYVYVWQQKKYDAVTGEMHCRIHFEFPDGTEMRNAFTYTWRLWGLPEMVELLEEAGFSDVGVYWEGDEVDKQGEPTGEGDGVFERVETAENCESFICYIVAQK